MGISLISLGNRGKYQIFFFFFEKGICPFSLDIMYPRFCVISILSLIYALLTLSQKKKVGIYSSQFIHVCYNNILLTYITNKGTIVSRLVSKDMGINAFFFLFESLIVMIFSSHNVFEFSESVIKCVFELPPAGVVQLVGDC